MQSKLTHLARSGALVAAMTLLASSLGAQTRVTLPAGSVFLVRTETPLESATMKVGQTFETSVIEAVSVNGYTLIPANSRIRGSVTYVQSATRERSGVMQVAFDRLTLSDGTAYPITARLTSTDSTERRQIEQRSDQRVVLVGERGGLGAAIAGAGSSKSPAAGILAALGNMLSEGRDVSVPAGTTFAVQLERSLTLTGRGGMNAADESTIYTAADRIRSAQQALARRGYYRGTPSGQLDNPTRRALFEFQLDNNITATGNLDGRTANALGILTTANAVTGAVLSAREATILRRAAQALVTRHRQDLGISTNGAINANSTISETDVDVLFAFSAFADNSSLYEQLVRASADTNGAVLAGRALVNAARRVDSALQAGRSSTQVQNVWRSIRTQLATLDPSYR
jgi:peptidoglycan hydrolase-like protein with peptidoglycan-binding domain